MKNFISKTIMLMITLTLISSSTVVWAQDNDKPTASADVSILSKYVWRGYELSRHSAVIQPSATVSYKDISFNMWANLDTDVYKSANSENLNETDLTLSYDKSFGMFNVGAGYIYYGLDAVADSQEFYLSVGLDTLLSPSVTVYREVAHWPSWYLSFGISHSFELPKNIVLDLGASVGYYSSNDDDFVEIDDNLNPTTDKYHSFHDGLISAGLTIPLGKYFSATPMVAYSFPLSDDAKNQIKSTNGFSNHSNYMYGGVTLSMAF